MIITPLHTFRDDDAHILQSAQILRRRAGRDRIHREVAKSGAIVKVERERFLVRVETAAAAAGTTTTNDKKRFCCEDTHITDDRDTLY